MRENNSKIINNKRLVLSSQTIFSVLLFMAWTRYTVCAYVIAVIKRLPLIGLLADSLYPLAIIALLIVGFSYIQKKIGIIEITIYFAVVGAMAISALLSEKNAYYIQREAVDILLSIAPMIFLGVCYDHEKQKKVLFWASLLTIVARIVFQIYSASLGNQMLYDSMGTAYRILPSTMYLIYWALCNKKLLDWVCAFVSAFLMTMFGTRGPILCIIVYLCVAFLYTTIKTKTWGSMLLRLLVVAVTAYFAFSDAIETVAKSLQTLFSELGMSTRIFDYFLEGTISEGTGRDALSVKIWEAIDNNLLFGYGLMGDRPILGGTYAHNLFLELWCHYGIFCGTALIIAILALAVKALKGQRGNQDVVLLLLMLICLAFVKLMVSNSYIRDEYFFFVLGILIATARSHYDTSNMPNNRKGETG